MRPESFAIADQDFLAFAYAFGSLARPLSRAEDEDANPPFHVSPTNGCKTISELSIRSLLDASIVVDEAGFISHAGGIHSETKFAIQREVVVGRRFSLCMVVNNANVEADEAVRVQVSGGEEAILTTGGMGGVYDTSNLYIWTRPIRHFEEW